MKIAFNPSTVAALTTPPNNKDITFDLRGQNIFARGVKFYGTDTNTWRDIKINNVSIGSNTLDLRNGSNTTLTNTNGVVTINSTWRPVVDNLTSDSTTSSLSAKQGKVLKALIDGKSNSDHNHDGRYVRYYAVTTLDCNNLAAGLTAARTFATNAAHTNHSAYLYISDVGTPFQIQIPDSSIPYIYKRYYGSGKWSGWFKLSAGYADSAGSVAWANVTNKPSTFNPAAHTHTVFKNNLMIKGTNGISDSASIHLGIGDSDTGFKWISDGVCQIYANNAAVGQWTSGGMNWFKNPTVNGNKVWNAGNDGSGSGLDADTLDGYHASAFSYKSWWHWYGKDGQPNWLWGGNNENDYYVYNPSNFRVAYASSAGNADTVDNEHASNFSYTHQSSFDFSKRKSGRIVTFDQSNTDYGWINGFASTHNDYLTSVIFNSHRTSNWYVGYMEGNMSTGETNGLQAVHKLAFADGDESYPIFLGYLNLFNGKDGTISSSFSCLGYSVPFTYTRGGAYCFINIPDTSFQTLYIKAAIASVHYSGAGMGHWVGNHRGDGAWWLHCYAVGSNAVQVKGFHLANGNNDSWWGGNPLYSDNGAAKIITVCLFGYVKFR